MKEYIVEKDGLTFVKPNGGCIKCKRCESVRRWHYCGRTKLTEKQLYNTKGYCSKFEPKEQAERKEE